MTITNDKDKRAVISKKWLYGSLAVAALLIGLFLDNDAVAGQNNSAPDKFEELAVEQATIANEDDVVERTTDTENDDVESYEDDMED